MSQMRRVRFEIESNDNAFVVIDQGTGRIVCIIDRLYYDNREAARMVGDYVVRALGGVTT